MAGEPLARLAQAEPGVNQQPGFVRFQVGAIPRGTAAQNGQLNGHDRDGSGPPSSPQYFYAKSFVARVTPENLWEFYRGAKSLMDEREVCRASAMPDARREKFRVCVLARIYRIFARACK